MSVNDVRVQGGVTREPEIGFGAATGTPYWKTTLAVNGTRFDPTERRQVVKTTWVSAVAFGWKAEQLMNEHLGKGDEIWVRGELDQSSWENKETGKNEHSTKVRIDSYDVVRRTSGSRQSAPRASMSASTVPSDDPWAPAPPRQQQPTDPPF